MSAATRSEVDEALAVLGRAVDGMDASRRGELAQALRAVLDGPYVGARTRPLWTAAVRVAEGATADRLGHLASTLEVAGPLVRQAVALFAEERREDDAIRGGFWAALGALVDALTGDVGRE